MDAPALADWGSCVMQGYIREWKNYPGLMAVMHFGLFIVALLIYLIASVVYDRVSGNRDLRVKQCNDRGGYYSHRDGCQIIKFKS